MAEVSIFTSLALIVTTILTVWLFFKTLHHKNVLYGIGIWMVIVALLGITGFYQKSGTLPPRFVLLIAPTILFVLFLFTQKKGKKFTLGGVRTRDLGFPVCALTT